MSNIIDERVVEMRFDNSDFEKNAKQSMDTLDQLDKKLKVTDATKALEGLGDASNTLKTSGLAGTVESIGQRFSALEAIAVGALMKIGSQAVVAGEQLLKAFTVDNISAGFDKFAKKTTSVGTLISQGFDIDNVSEQLDRLAWFTDETSYNFTDMVDNIGKFTASGQQLEPSVTAMEGIATWAALSGQNATTASRAMYQLAQAMGKGVLKYDDWKSIQNANMDTIEFRKNAVQAAVDLGKLKKTGNDTFTTLGGKVFDLNALFTSDALSKQGWFDSDVMMKTFNQYSGAIQDIYEYAEEHGVTASEAIEQLNGSIDEFGLKAFRAAQEARSWADVVDSVKDAVSSTWMETFELIFGNYEEAVDLFTDMANALYDVFAEGGNRRNEILQEWKDLGGRTYLIEALYSVFRKLGAVMDTVKEAFRDIFPETTGRRLAELTVKFYNFVSKMKASDETMKNLKDTFRGLFAILDMVGQVIVGVVKALFPALKSCGSLVEVILRVTGAIGRFIVGLSRLMRESGVVEKAMNGIKTAIMLVAGVIVMLIAKIIELTTQFMQLEAVQKIFAMIRTGFQMVLSVIGGLITSVAALATNFGTLATSASLSFFNGIKTAFTAISTVISNVIKKVQELTSAILDKFPNVKELFEQIKEAFGNIFSKWDETDGTFIERLQAAFEELKNNVQPVIDALKNFAKSIDPSKAAAIGLAVAVILAATGFAKLAKSITSMTDNIGGAAKKIGNFFGTLTNGFKKTQAQNFASYARDLSLSIGILVGSLYVLSKIGLDMNLIKSIGVLALLGGILIGLTAIMAKLYKWSDAQKIQGVSLGLIGLSVAISILVASLVLIDQLGPLTDLKRKIMTIAAICAILSATMVVLGFSKASLRSALVMLAFSFAIKQIMEILISISNFNLAFIKDSFLEIVAIIGLLTAAAIAAGRLGVGTFVNLALVGAALYLFGDQLNQFLNSFSPDEALEFVEKNKTLIIQLGALLLIIAGITALLGPGIKKFGSGMLGVSIALLAMVGVMKLAGKMKPEVFEQGCLALAEFGSFIALFLLLSQYTENSKMIQFGVGLVLITGCMYAMVGLASLAGLLASKQESLWGGIGVLAIVTGLIAALMAISKLTEGVKTGPILVAIAGVATLFAMIMLFPDLDLSKYVGSIILAIGCIAALAILFAAVDNLKDVKAAGVAALTISVVAIGVLFAEIILLSKTVKDVGIATLATTFGGMIAVVAALAGLLWVIGGKGGIGNVGTWIRKIAVIATIVAGLTVMMASIGALAYFSKDIGILIASIGAMVICMAALAGLMFVIDKIHATKKTFDKIKMLGVLALEFMILAGALAILNHNTETFVDTLVSAGALTAVMFALAFLLKILDGIAKSTDFATIGTALLGMVALAGTMYLVALSISKLADFKWYEIGAAVAALAIVMGEFALILGVLGALGAYTGELGTIAFGAVAASFVAMGIAFTIASAGIFIVAKAFEIFVPALRDLVSIGLEEVGNALLTLAIGIGELGIAGIVLAAGSVGYLIFAGAMLVLSGAIWIVSQALPNVVEAFNSFKSGEELLKMGAGLVLIGAGLGVMGIALFVVGAGLLFINPLLDTAAKLFETFSIGLEQIGNSIQVVGLGIQSIGAGLQSAVNALASAGPAIMGIGIAFQVLSASLATINIAQLAIDLIALSVACSLAGTAGSILGAGAAGITTAASAISSLGFAVSQFSTIITSSLNTLLDSVRRILNDISSYLRNSSATLKAEAEGIGGNIVGGLISGLQRRAGEAVEMARKLARGVMEMIHDATGCHSDSKETGQIAMDIINGLVHTFQKGKSYLESNTESTFKGVIDTIKNVFSGMESWMSNHLGIVSIFKTVTDKGSESVKKFKQYASEKDWMKDVGFSFEDLKDKTKGFVDEMTEGIPKMDEFSQGLGKAGGAASQAKDEFATLKDTIGNQIDIFSEFNKKTELTGTKLLENMRSQVAGVTEWSYQVAALADKGIDQGLLQKLAEMGPQGYEYVNAFTQMTTDELAQANVLWQQSLTLPEAAASLLTTGLANVAKNACIGYANAIDTQAGVEQIGTTMQNGIDKAEEVTDEHSPSVVYYQIGKYMMEGLRIGITNYVGTVLNALQVACYQMINRTRATLQVGTFTEIGANICEGLKRAIDDGTPGVMEKVDALCAEIKAKIEKSMEINSPSRYMYRIGRYLDQGLANGISDNADYAVGSAEYLADRTLSVMNDTITALYDAINGEFDIDPTITPVLDLSNVRAGAQEVNGLFESTRISARTSKWGEVNEDGTPINGGITYNQYNYSPKSLSRIEIYRQTKNQLSSMKGLVEG